MKEYLIVERLSEGLAVLELSDRSHLELPVEVLPPKTKPGDALYLEKGKLYLDMEETCRRKKKSTQLFRYLLDKEE